MGILGTLNEVGASLMAGLIRHLPYKTSVKIKERLEIIRKIDYPRKNIFINLESHREFLRLRYFAKEYKTTSKWIEEYIQKGDVFYDIGANVGGYSLICHAKTDGDCLCYAFEPSFSTFAELCKNVFINGCQDKIIPLNIALSDKTELFPFLYSSIAPGVAGGGHGIKGHPGEHRKGKEKSGPKLARVHGHLHMMLFKLDDLIAQFQLRPPSHIKIDVDGSERFVLKGALSTLKNLNLKSVQIEIHPQFDPDNEILAIMTDAGFTLTKELKRGNNLFIR